MRNVVLLLFPLPNSLPVFLCSFFRQPLHPSTRWWKIPQRGDNILGSTEFHDVSKVYIHIYIYRFSLSSKCWFLRLPDSSICVSCGHGSSIGYYPKPPSATKKKQNLQVAVAGYHFLNHIPIMAIPYCVISTLFWSHLNGHPWPYLCGEAIQIIIKMAFAAGVARVWCGTKGLLSTPATSAVIRCRGGKGYEPFGGGAMRSNGFHGEATRDR